MYEVPFLISFFYPTLNTIWWFPKCRPSIEKEIIHEPAETNAIQLYEYYSQYHPPVYANVNNVSIPIGGYTTKETRSIASRHVTKNKTYSNFYQIDDKEDIKESYKNTSHINTHEVLNTICSHYNIPLNSFPIHLPLKVKHYYYKNGVYLHPLGSAATNKEKLVKNILWRKRLPLTCTVPAIGSITLGMCWLYYNLMKPCPSFIPPFKNTFNRLIKNGIF